jgi:hypothetical protein
MSRCKRDLQTKNVEGGGDVVRRSRVPIWVEVRRLRIPVVRRSRVFFYHAPIESHFPLFAKGIAPFGTSSLWLLGAGFEPENVLLELVFAILPGVIFLVVAFLFFPLL